MFLTTAALPIFNPTPEALPRKFFRRAARIPADFRELLHLKNLHLIFRLLVLC